MLRDLRIHRTVLIAGAIAIFAAGAAARGGGVRNANGQAQPAAQNDPTALLTAASQGNATVVASLLANGADANAKDDGGDTALMKAAAAGSVDVVAGAVRRDPSTRSLASQAGGR